MMNCKSFQIEEEEEEGKEEREGIQKIQFHPKKNDHVTLSEIKITIQSVEIERPYQSDHGYNFGEICLTDLKSADVIFLLIL